MLIGGDDISNDVIILGADWRKSDSWVEGEPQGNWRWNSNSRDIVASSPSFSRPALRAPRRVGSQAKIRQTDLHKYSCTIHPGSKVSFCLFLNWGGKMEASAESRPIVSSLQGCRSPNFWTSLCREIQCCTCITVKFTKPWTPEIFMECYCDARNKPIRCKITKPQTASAISLWFWGLLAYPELYCDWPLHNQHSWNFPGVHGFLSLTVNFNTRREIFDLRAV